MEPNTPSGVVSSDDKNLVQTALAAGMLLGAPRTVSFDPRKRAYILVPKGDGAAEVQYVDAPDRPQRPTGSYVFHTLDSFMTFVLAQKGGSSAVFAVRGELPDHKAKFGHGIFNALAVLNENDKDSPAWRDFRATWAPPLSESFKVWMGSNGVKFENNVAFAEFLEDHAEEIVDPAGATILELAVNFNVQGAVQFSNPVDLQNGAIALSMTKTVGQAANSKVVIPKRFVIEIPINRDDSRKHRFPAHFRFRLHDGGVTIWYQFIRPEVVIEQAFKEAVAAINTQTGLPVMIGDGSFVL